MTLERGSLLNNRYRILEILGQGGMGSIYRAVDENLGVEVAVKENLFTTEEYARQFRREAVILANLRHPNLPRVTDHFVIEPQGQYLIMDFIEGEDLRERMDRDGVLPDAEVVILGSALGDALSYLHTRQPQIIHRDIKPGNVKINPNGQILLVDFGLAKVVENSGVTTTGARAMTPGYSPPEQYGTAKTDERSDIYSLGATLYVALTNELPEDALARAMGQTELTPIRRYNPKVSRKLAAAIEKALELRPEDRFHSAEEFKQALLNTRLITGKVPTGEGSLAPPIAQTAERASSSNNEAALLLSAAQATPPSGERSRSVGSPLFPTSTPISEPVYVPVTSPPFRKAKRRRSCLIYLLIFGVVLGILLAWAVIYEPARWNDAVKAAEQWLSNSRVPVNLAFLIPEASPTPTNRLPLDTPSQATPIPELINVISSPTPTQSPTSTLTLKPSSTPTLSPTPNPTGTPVGRGGGLIAYASDASELPTSDAPILPRLPQIWVMNTDGTGKRKLIEMPEGACQPAWSPDGLQLVFISPCKDNQESYPGASLHIVSVDGTGYKGLESPPGGDFDPAWSPDGTQIIFTSVRDSNRRQIYSYNLEDGTTKSISNNVVNDFQPSWSPDGTQIVFLSTRKSIYNQVYIMDKDGSDTVAFSRSGDLDNSHPVWQPPKADWIMFTQYRENQIPRIVLAPVPDGNPEYIIPPVNTPMYSKPMKEAVYSPDGTWIAFEGYPQGEYSHDIYIMNAKGLFLDQLTDNPGKDFDAAWQPAVIP